VIPFLLLLAGLNQTQVLPPISAAHDYARLRDGINPPRLLHSSDPQYTPEAVAAQISGTVVLHAIVDVNGNVAYASVLSPLPDGLDEKALQAVKQWKYAPAVMDGELIPALTIIDVVFRPPYQPPDAAKTKQPANQDDARALFLQGNLQRAAFLGSTDAQIKMGEKEESAKNLREAKHYFRMCAATAHPACEFRLGRLLVTGTDTNPDDFSEGVAWLELSKNHGDKDAARLYETSAAKLSSIQIDWVRRLEPHLELKDYKGF
jgi:TonB family protein